MSGPVSDRRVREPSPVLLALEQLAVLEFGAFLASSPFLRVAGRVDRHPVLVLPGFAASDRSTMPLRALLRSHGYWVHGWALGRNVGPTAAIVEGLEERLVTLFERHGAKVSLVGWSLGGIFARELGRVHPQAVRQVITLGSPFRLRDGDRTNASALAGRFADRYVAMSADAALPEDERASLTVPVTNIYTRTDGVVRWHVCIDSDGPERENIEVRGSHIGLGHNPTALIAIMDRLTQREGEWRPFRAPFHLAHMYPTPEWHNSAVPVAIPA
jgi:pimeloyl-ACP methyl ester carboxylesterase